MKPGRELDALVAERVMGAVRGSIGFQLDLCPHYSTDISAAWEVIENLLKRNVIFRITCCRKGGVVSGVGTFGFIDEEGETIPAAVCMVALKVVDSGKED